MQREATRQVDEMKAQGTLTGLTRKHSSTDDEPAGPSAKTSKHK